MTKKCYVTGEVVNEMEMAEVKEMLTEENYDKVVGYYNLIKLEGNDEHFTDEGDVVLSKAAVVKALNN